MELTPSKVPVRRPANHALQTACNASAISGICHQIHTIKKTTFFKLYAMLAPMVDHTETDEPKHTKSDTTAEAMTILAEICTAART